MTKLNSPARINRLSPVKSHNSYNWDLADIIFGDPLQGPSKRQEQKKAAQDRWKEKKAARSV